MVKRAGKGVGWGWRAAAGDYRVEASVVGEKTERGKKKSAGGKEKGEGLGGTERGPAARSGVERSSTALPHFWENFSN